MDTTYFRSSCRRLLGVIALGWVTAFTTTGAFAEETPPPALPVVNKGHRDSTRPGELAIVDPGSGRMVARIPTGMESREVAVVTNTGPYSDPGQSLFREPKRAVRNVGQAFQPDSDPTGPGPTTAGVRLESLTYTGPAWISSLWEQTLTRSP